MTGSTTQPQRALTPDEATLARIAGDIASCLGWDALNNIPDDHIAQVSVNAARAIVAEVQQPVNGGNNGEKEPER